MVEREGGERGRGRKGEEERWGGKVRGGGEERGREGEQ